MPRFAWVARAGDGGQLEGQQDAADTHSLADALSAQGLLLIRAEAVLAENAGAVQQMLAPWRERLFGTRVAITDLILMCRQLATLLRAGVPLLRALSGLQESATHAGLARVLADVQAQLSAGRELSVALAAHPLVFTPFMVSTVRVGELTGRLPEAFDGLYRQLSFEKENREAVAGALRYPMFVLAVTLAALLAVNLFVIPAFASVYAGLRAELPLLTRLLIAISKFFVSFWPLLLAGGAAAAFAFSTWVRSEAGQRVWHGALLKLPIIGPLLHKAALARFTQSFAIAMNAGVPVVDAIEAAVATTGNVVLAEKIRGLREGAERGESLARAARATGAFTPVVLQMIAVGEETGALDDMMEEVAGFYGKEVEAAVKALGSQIEPVLVIVLGGFVLVFALGVFLPMWDLSRVAIK
jgi:MSHA biogenesis protein MshG